MIIPVRNVGAIGLAPDVPYEKLPLNAWTDAKNVRFVENGAEKFTGHSEVLASPLWAPYWLMPVNTGATAYWLYAGLTKVGATDQATHADITRTVGGDYGATADKGWTGAMIEGIPVITNGIDVPQMWNPPALATPLAALTAWPATYTCESIRALKRYLVAFNITKGGVNHPYMVKWSDQAPSNDVPASWDETDATIDAGEYTLTADGGVLVDAAPIRDLLMVYTETASWLMQYVGGIDIFRLTRQFSSFGMLTKRSAIEFFNGKHIVFTGDDVIMHDSQQAKSLMDQRAKSLLRGLIDSTYFKRTFVVANYPAKEVWVCVPEIGQSLPSKALVWNWITDLWGVRELPSAAFIAAGVVNPIDSGELWSGASGDWESDTIQWGDRSFVPTERALLMAAPNATKLYLADNTRQFDGVNMTAILERRDIGWPLKDDGPPDFSTRKLLRGIWPRISGTQGGRLTFYFGVRDNANPDTPITWSTGCEYIIGTTEFVDTLGLGIEGRLHSIKIESDTNIRWKLTDYDADVVPTGKY